MGCPGGTRSVFTRAFRAKRELQCIFLGRKAIIITSKHGTTISFSHFNLFLVNTARVYRIVLIYNYICKPDEGWYGQPKYCYEKTIPVVLNQLCSSLWTSRFWFLIFWLIRFLFQRSNDLQLAGSSSTVFAVNSIPFFYYSSNLRPGTTARGGSRGRMQGVRTPPPLR